MPRARSGATGPFGARHSVIFVRPGRFPTSSDSALGAKSAVVQSPVAAVNSASDGGDPSLVTYVLVGAAAGAVGGILVGLGVNAFGNAVSGECSGGCSTWGFNKLFFGGISAGVGAVVGGVVWAAGG